MCGILTIDAKSKFVFLCYWGGSVDYILENIIVPEFIINNNNFGTNCLYPVRGWAHYYW